jgi:hypothetical protein
MRCIGAGCARDTRRDRDAVNFILQGREHGVLLGAQRRLERIRHVSPTI